MTDDIQVAVLQEWVRQLQTDLAALRQRHAKAVEAAFREGYFAGDGDYGHNYDDEAWLASQAKKGLESDRGK